MSWASEFSEDAQDDLKALPKHIQRRVSRVLDQMANDPFQGDVKALKGKEWSRVLRRRIGDYRILFTVDHAKKTFWIVRILIRSEDAYRKRGL